MILRRNFLKGVFGSIFSGSIFSGSILSANENISDKKKNIAPIPKFIKVNKYKFPVLVYSSSDVLLDKIRVIYDMEVLFDNIRVIYDVEERSITETVFLFNNNKEQSIYNMLYQLRCKVDMDAVSPGRYNYWGFRLKLENTTICIADDWSSGLYYSWSGKIIRFERPIMPKKYNFKDKSLQNDHNWDNLEFIY